MRPSYRAQPLVYLEESGISLALMLGCINVAAEKEQWIWCGTPVSQAGIQI
ncbi:hypothetical protein [Roseovarius sp. M141]|uniref:hypothetical protein n=1 Tax=Roseovarius sp. M141 TaxID=2583806 RepID=UPI0020CF22C1|nr:hypothetical protein [Roseovarius sp. M141]